MTRTLVFCHANSFTAGTYDVLFEAWRQAGWRVLAPDKLGHDPRYPVTNGWRHLRDELLHFIEHDVAHNRAHNHAHHLAHHLAHSAGLDGPVVLVGHSMGGYLSLLAASRKPALVNAVVLLDSPIVSGWRAPAFGLLKLSGLMGRGGPGKASARRRAHWPSLEAAREHFAGKAAFARWDARVLADYLQHGFVADRRGLANAVAVGGTGAADEAHTAPVPKQADASVTLAFKRETETRIYNTLPHDVPALLARHPLRCPVGYIGSKRSAESLQLGIEFVRKLAGPRWKWIEGSHLFPMERPEETAAAVLDLLASMAPASPAATKATTAFASSTAAP